MGNKFNDETLIPTDYVYVVADKYGKSLVTDENGDFYSRPLQYYHVVVVSPLKPYLAYFIFDQKFTDDVELRCGKMETKDIYYCLSADEARHKDVTLKNKIEGNVALELNEFISKLWFIDDLTEKSKVVKEKINKRNKVSIAELKEFEDVFNKDIFKFTEYKKKEKEKEDLDALFRE